MADKSNQSLVESLGRALAEPAGAPLFSTKTRPGLFAAAGPAKLLAQRCKDEGYLRVLRCESKGRSNYEICALSDKGLAFLVSQARPESLLGDLLQGIESRRAEIGEMVATARQIHNTLDTLKDGVEKVLARLATPLVALPSTNGSASWKAGVASFLAWRESTRPSQDCPLPDLFRHAQTLAPELTIGHFHDGLRDLHENGQIYLHPWTGPLSDLPEPAYAVLVGHEIVFYASLRNESGKSENS